MKIHIKNIGMLDEAEFEVGDLTLICGENNTGKTYATYSLYGYLDFMKKISALRIFDILDKFQNKIKNEENYIVFSMDIFKEIITELYNYLQRYYSKKLHLILGIKENNKQYFSDNMLKICLQDIMKNSCEQDRYGFKYSIKDNQIYIDKVASNDSMNLIITTALIGGITGALFGKNIQSALVGAGAGGLVGTIANENNTKGEFINLLYTFFATVIKETFPTAFILSSERTGISIFHQECTMNWNKIINKAQNSQDIIETLYSQSSYAKPLQDNIQFMKDISTLNSLSFIQKESKSIHSKIIELLEQLVGGKYNIVNSEIKFLQKDSKEECPIVVASSSVRSLLMLNFYILYVAQKGDILMIDEPELNLHPKNQILVARLLVLLVNAGIKVFITTHSDYIVRELSNCIMLKNLSNEQVKKLIKQGYSKEYGLESKKVEAYLAENIKGKNTLRAMKITQEQGIFMETFDEPIDSQNENQGLIFEESMRNKRNSDDK